MSTATAIVREHTLADGTVQALGWPMLTVLDAPTVERGRAPGVQGYEHELNEFTGQDDAWMTVLARRPDGSAAQISCYASQIGVTR